MKMRPLVFVLAVSALVALAPADYVRLKLTRKGKSVGQATFSMVREPGGGKTVEMRIAAKGLQSSASMTEATRYDRTGREVKKERVTNVDKRLLSHLTAVFDAKGVTVTGQSEEGKESKRYPLPPGTSTADASKGWFVVSRPKPGAKVASMTFSLTRFAWRSTQTTYVGPTTVSIANKKVPGNLIRSVTGNEKLEIVLDNRGFPLTMTDDRGLRMVRLGGVSR